MTTKHAAILLCLCVAPATAQPLTLRPAIELEFPASPGRGYQVEASSTLEDWNPAFDVVRGDGGIARHFLQAGDPRQFFRLTSHEVRDVTQIIEGIRAANGVPALACAVVLSNRIVALGATGLRRAGTTNAPVTVDDKWHHGSLTKSVTATLAALLVEQGRIRWDSTLAEVFPADASQMQEAWRAVRLDWLCSNHGGAPNDLSTGGLWTSLWNFQGTPREGRRFLLQRLTAVAPSTTPGTAYEYSNAGFSLAGHMLETVMDRAWEDLVTDYVFKPLGMTSGGFGVPATPRHINQPWGHQWANGIATPVEPGTSADNPPAIGPSATVHCSVTDLARYVAFHLAGHRQDMPGLSQASFLKLHTAVPNNAGYAYGWVVTARPWAQGDALTHVGSNLQWYSVIWMAPNRQFGVVALCNTAAASGPNPAATATDQIAGRMIQEFLPN